MKKNSALLIALALSAGIAAQNTESDLIKRASEHFESGTYIKALPMYSQLLSLNPESPEYNYRFGACAVFGGKDKSTPVKHLTYATKKSVGDARAWYFLGLAHHLNYQFKDAEQAYKEFIQRADSKTSARYPAARQAEMAKNGKTLLNSIKDIVVLDKKQGGESDFFRFFDLEATGGKILVTPEELLSKTDKKPGELNLIYFPKGATEIYFSTTGKDVASGRDLFKATVLPDGKFSSPVKLPSTINTSFDENFAFLHPDGKSFYFASRGHNSMGGYDIFRSEYNASAGSFGRPVNLDFAINTPDDDIFYIADSNNETAYFASSRNAEQGVYNVYKVRVEGMPIQMVFIQGNYFSEIDNKDRQARLTVVDELTGRTVDMQNTDRVTGDYVLSLPKSGQFRLEVQAKTSTLKHEHVMQIPSYTTAVALRQELTLYKDGGAEKLRVTSHFDTPLNIDLTELQAAMLRSKSNLEITPENQSESEAMPDLVFEKTVNNAPLAAGFDESTTLAQITDNMSTEAAVTAGYADGVKSKSLKAFAIADQRQQQAQKLNTQISDIKSRTKPGDADYAMQMAKAYKMIEESRVAGLEARSALELAKQTEKFSEQEKQRSRDLTNNALALNSGTDFDKTVSLLNAEKERLRKGNATKNPGIAAGDMSTLKEDEARKSTDRLVALRSQEKSVANDVKVLERQKENTSKKKDLEEINSLLAARNVELAGIRQDISRQEKNTVKLSADGEMYRIQSIMFDDLMAGRNDYGVQSEIPMSAEGQSQLENDLIATLSQTEQLDITDAETLGLITEEMTGNGANRLASVESGTALSSSEPTESKPSGQPRSNYDAEKARLSKLSDPKLEAYRSAFLAEKTKSAVEAEIELIKSGKSDTTANSPEGKVRLAELESLRNLTASEAKSSVSLTPASNEAKSSLGNLVSGDYPELNRADVPMSELAQTTNDRLDYLSALKGQYHKAGDVLLTSNSPSELESAQRELTAYKSIERDMVSLLMPSSSEPSYRLELKSSAEPESVRSKRVNALETSLQSVRLSPSIPAPDRQNLVAAYETEIIKLKSEPASAVASSDPARALPKENLTELKIKSLPLEDDKIIDSVYPGYSNLYASSSDVANPAKIAAREDLLTEAQSRLNSAITDRQRSLDLLTSVEEQEKVQIEITRLASQREKVSIELKTLQESDIESIGLINVESPEDTVITFAPGTNEAEKEKLMEILQPAEPVDPDYVFDNDMYYDLVDSNSDKELEIKNGQAMSETKSEIAALEMQIQSETNTSKVRKLDLKNEDLYARLALQEMSNADKLTKMADNRNEENISRIGALEVEKKDMLSNHLWLRNEIETLKEEAAAETEKAEKQRQQYKKTPDPIKQNFYYREALAWDLSALERQRKAIQILEEANLVVAQKVAAQPTFETRAEERKEEAITAEEIKANPDSSPSAATASKAENGTGDKTDSTPQVTTAASGVQSGTNTDATAGVTGQSAPTSTVPMSETVQPTRTEGSTNTVKSTVTSAAPSNAQSTGPTTGSAGSSNTTSGAVSVTSPATTVPSTSISGTSDQAASSGNITYTPLTSSQSGLSGPADKYSGLQPVNRGSGATFVINDDAYIKKAFAQSLGLDESQTAKAMNNPEVKAYLAQVDKAKANQAELKDKENQRSQMVSDLNAIQVKIEKLEAAREKAPSQAEKDALTAEINVLAAQADAQYIKIQDLDKVLDTKFKAQEKLLAEINSDFKAIDLDAIADKSSGMSSASPASSKQPVEDPTAGFADSSPSPAGSGDAAERYGVNAKYYVYPRTLSENLFSINSDAIYTSKNPIPTRPEMPDGVVFRVQVGAYRNAIAQNQFKGIAPMAAEKLNNGLTRYVAGLFVDIDGATAAKDQIRQQGYPDAFVVAYRNGIRIPIYEALGQSKPATLAPVTKTSIASSVPTSNGTGSTKAASDPASFYSDFGAAAKAEIVNNIMDLFYTVQVGVYSRPVPVEKVFNLQPLNAEILADGKVRYSTGKYTNLSGAAGRKTEVIAAGIQDSFVTAYHKGNRITIEQAQIIESGGSAIEKVIDAEK